MTPTIPGIHHITAITTDPPGFTVDEQVEELGFGLRLPPWLEPQRGRIESVLPPVRVAEAGPR